MIKLLFFGFRVTNSMIELLFSHFRVTNVKLINKKILKCYSLNVLELLEIDTTQISKSLL